MFDSVAPKKSRTAHVFGFVIGALGFITFLYFYYIRYFQWRDCFNELGRCYDPDGSHDIYTTAGQFWGWLAIPFFILMLVTFRAALTPMNRDAATDRKDHH